MNSKRGSAGIALLTLAFFLGLVAIVVGRQLAASQQRGLVDLRRMQLEEMAISALKARSALALESGERDLGGCLLYPGGVEARLREKVDYGADNCARYMEVTAAAGDEKQKMKELRFKLTSELYAYTGNAVTAAGAVRGGEYLVTAGWAANQAVRLPEVYDLLPWSIDELNAQELRLYGFARRFYYSAEDWRPPMGLAVLGDAVIAADGNAVIAESCRFSGRLVILARNKIVVKNGAVLNNALLLAQDGVRLEAGCTVNGIVISGGDVEITGPVNFTYDRTAAEPFVSVIFII